MRIIRHLGSISSAQQAVVALGNFDGVHLGHQAVLARARALADAANAPFAVMTFQPHPRAWFNPALKPLNIYPLHQKLRLLAEAGADVTFVLRFDARLSGMSAEAFVQEILHRALRVRHAVTGEHFMFGRGRGGDAAFLKRSAEALGFAYTQVAEVEDTPGMAASSSRIRALLGEGRVAEASALLGRPYAITGRVQRGEGRGRQLGAPTANLTLACIFRPAFGVYAVRARVPGGVWMDGVANCGVRPTFGGTQPGLEVHCFEVREDMYGRRLEVRLLHYLRPERRFADAQALAAQIAADMMQAKAALAQRKEEAL
ncbi:MAG: bifunctional riboflavin kinase/FAD synthetase [Alphaproteobacteria bacterium]|nr:bifunctional riboflavin kinase/FAD synthetase [Alphaproteobacteria bacterium]